MEEQKYEIINNRYVDSDNEIKIDKCEERDTDEKERVRSLISNT